MNTKTEQQEEFWTHRQALFTGTFRSFRNQPKPVYGRFHVSEERYFDRYDEIVPLSQVSGSRTYVLFQPYVLVPNIIVTVGLYPKPKHYADMDPAVGEVLSSRKEQEREEQIGSGQAWYYPADQVLVLWECLLYGFVRDEPQRLDRNMRVLWTSIEHWLLRQLPDTQQIVTPWSDPAFATPEYQAFLRRLGYQKVRGHPAYGKPVHRR